MPPQKKEGGFSHRERCALPLFLLRHAAQQRSRRQAHLLANALDATGKPLLLRCAGVPGLVIKFAHIYPTVSHDESLNVFLIASFAFERSCDAKPVNILIQFHMHGAFFAPSTPVNDPSRLF
jgi:hypothetical protein